QNTAGPAAIANSASTSWNVQSAASLTVNSVVASRAVVSRGQSGLTVQVSVTNTGLATSGATVTNLLAGLRFNGSTANYTVTTAGGNATSVAAGASAILTFTVNVGAGATLGSNTIAVAVTAS